MASGWSWEPATVLGNRDTNQLNPILPPIKSTDKGPPPAVSLPSIMNHVGGNENVPPPQLKPLPGKPVADPSVATAPNALPPGVIWPKGWPVPDLIPYVPRTQSKGLQHRAGQPQVSPRNSPLAAAPPKASNVPKKRKSDAVSEPQTLPDISDDDPRLEEVDQTCNQIRGKIRRFIDSGVMKVGEFQKAIGVGSASYQRFMNQNGPDAGSGSDVYWAASKFFKKRELQGIKAPPAKRAKNVGKTDALDVGDMKLDDEDRGNVPVFDTCDEIRKKIRAILRKDGVTQAAFLREVGKCFPSERKIQTKQLSDFLTKKGPSVGNTSSVFYGSYVFFEKLRLKQAKPKTATRLEMEREYPGGDGTRPDGRPGMNTTERESGWVTVHSTERAYQNQYGKLQIINKGTGRSVF
ncbi:hypothetical protein BJ170DRAFT_690127 [Xylariales sp. AK1849]|nr:hypothetical protein BJ170DRAFT_690127 [Xylariales sp. AK1849]